MPNISPNIPIRSPAYPCQCGLLLLSTIPRLMKMYDNQIVITSIGNNPLPKPKGESTETTLYATCLFDSVEDSQFTIAAGYDISNDMPSVQIVVPIKLK